MGRWSVGRIREDTMTDKKAGESRRDFLKLAGAAAPAAVAAAVVAPDAEAEEVQAGEGLRKTAHVEAYLRSARF